MVSALHPVDAQDDDQDDDAEEPEAPPPRSGRRNSIPLLLEATAALGGGAAAAGPAEGYAGKRHPGAPYRRPSLSLAQPVLPEHEAGYDDSSPEDSSISQGRHAPHAADQMDEDIDDETLRRKALDSNPARYVARYDSLGVDLLFMYKARAEAFLFAMLHFAHVLVLFSHPSSVYGTDKS